MTFINYTLAKERAFVSANQFDRELRQLGALL
jgi:hypothetical protein